VALNGRSDGVAHKPAELGDAEKPEHGQHTTLFGYIIRQTKITELEDARELVARDDVNSYADVDEVLRGGDA